jgi:hypothetical protein
MSGHDEAAQETSINVAHLRRQESAGTKQQATSISQPSVTTDSPLLDESAVQLQQLQRPEQPHTVQHKAHDNIQTSSASILTTASALGGEVSAQEPSITLGQIKQQQPQATKQRASSISQPSLATGAPILDESAVHLDQHQRTELPQTIHYKPSDDIQASTSSIITTAYALSGEETAQETPININQLRQPTAKDLPAIDTTKQKASSVTKPSAMPDVPILDETSVHLDQIHRPTASEAVQYKAQADIQPSTGSFVTTASALGEEVPAQEPSVNLGQLTQQQPQATKQRASSISQPSLATGAPILDESAVHLDQHQRTELPQSVTYKPPADIHPLATSILTTASALGREEPAQETSININQLRQPTAKDLHTLDTTKQQASSVTELSATTDFPPLEESPVHLDQIHRPDVPQAVQYKAQAEIQPSTSSIITTASALGEEVSAQEPSVNLGQLTQQQAQATKQRASSISQPSLATGAPILDESAVHLDQLQRAALPQSIHYKPSDDIQISTGSFLTTASALGGEELAQETPINITQLRQPTAKDLPATDTTKQQVSSVTQPSATTDLPILDETSVRLDQIQRPEIPQTVQYKAPADIKPSTASILTTASALSAEEPIQESSVTLDQLTQQQPQATKQRATSISQPSLAADTPILDETAVHVGQHQRSKQPQPVHYKPSHDIQASTGSILTTASALSGEVPAQETALNISQLRQPVAKDLSDIDSPKQRASSITQPSATTDFSALDETAVQLDQIQRSETPVTIQYKAPGDIQPSTGTFVTTASALSEEVPAQERSIALGQLSQEQPQATKQRASSISQPSLAADVPILDESAVHLDQHQRAELPQSVTYKPPADIQPLAGSMLTTASALGREEPAQETSININQLRQPTAKDLPTLDTTKQQASSVTELSATTDFPPLEESPVHLDQIHRPDTPQAVQYKVPSDIQPSSGSLLTIASALSGEESAQDTAVKISQLRQPTAKDLPGSDTTKQQASSVTELSATTDFPPLDESAVQLDQIQRPEAPQNIQYKAPADIQPSTGSLLTTAFALS